MDIVTIKANMTPTADEYNIPNSKDEDNSVVGSIFHTQVAPMVATRTESEFLKGLASVVKIDENGIYSSNLGK